MPEARKPDATRILIGFARAMKEMEARRATGAATLVLRYVAGAIATLDEAYPGAAKIVTEEHERVASADAQRALIQFSRAMSEMESRRATGTATLVLNFVAGAVSGTAKIITEQHEQIEPA